MIRGQPRPHSQSTSSSTASGPVIPSQPYASRSPPVASPRPRPSSSGMKSPDDYRHHSRQNTVVPPVVHRRSYHGGFQPNFEATTSSQLYNQLSASYSDPNLAAIDLSSIFPPSSLSFTPSTLSPPETGNFDTFSLTAPSFTFDSQLQGVASNSGQNAVQQEHVLYYFEHVRKIQYIFAGSNLITNMIYSVSLDIWSAFCSR
jgi:hypothetical protein